MTSRKCEVTTCTIRVPHDSLMCLHHWKRVSNDTKRRVYQARRAYMTHTLGPQMYQAVLDVAKKEAVAG